MYGYVVGVHIGAYELHRCMLWAEGLRLCFEGLNNYSRIWPTDNRLRVLYPADPTAIDRFREIQALEVSVQRTFS